jgi:hypothetical protein
MPTFLASDIVFLSLVVAGFAVFAVTLLYYSIAAALREQPSSSPAPSRDSTPARRAEPGAMSSSPH